MTLHDKIITIYPGLTSLDFIDKVILQNDGDERGDYIALWNHPVYQQPTQSQLDIVTSPAVVIPQEVTAWQAKTALANAGLYAQVESAILVMTGDAGMAARISWYSAQMWKRDWPLVAAMQQAFGWTDEYVNQLFIAAAQL